MNNPVFMQLKCSGSPRDEGSLSLINVGLIVMAKPFDDKKTMIFLGLGENETLTYASISYERLVYRLTEYNAKILQE